MPAPSQTTTETRMLGSLLIFAIFGTMTGCGNGSQSNLELPAPLRSDFPYSLSTTENWSWEANSFECRLDGIMHRFVSKGITTPRQEDPQFQKAVDQFRDLISQTPVRCVVVERDEFQREVAFVFARKKPVSSPTHSPSVAERSVSTSPSDVEFDVGLQMIELGLAKYDGTQFETSRIYQDAEIKARQAKLGIWQ